MASARPDTAIVDASLAQGALLAALDAANSLIEGGESHPRVRYLRILSLARMGETAEALRELDEWITREPVEDEDSLALRGRLLKDLALQHGSDRGALFHEASRAYMAAHVRAGGYFSLVNAATLAMLSGDAGEAGRLAEKVLDFPEISSAADFYAWATAAEASVLLGDHDSARHALTQAMSSEDATLGSRAAAARQLRLLAEHRGDRDVAALASLVMPPPVLVYSGQRFRSDVAIERRINERIDETLAERDVRVAFGGAAAGADILIAEAVVRRGAELNIVLPFAEADYVREAVRSSGAEWQARYDSVMAAAHSVTYATSTPFVGDSGQFDYGDDVAMGHACLRADHLQTEATLVSVQASDRPPGDRGGASVDRWRRSGREALVVSGGTVDHRPLHPTSGAHPDEHREVRSIIFTDFSGFSKLEEQHLPVFLREVMGRMAAVLDLHAEDVLFRNTWGDALFAVVSDPSKAADLALSLTERLQEIDATVLGLDAGAGMRIGVHHGPVYRSLDPITGKPGYFGSEVTYTARLEPVTPVGKVYVTQPFAALLALAADRRFRCQYVGPVALAKSFATLPMYRLSRS